MLKYVDYIAQNLRQVAVILMTFVAFVGIEVQARQQCHVQFTKQNLTMPTYSRTQSAQTLYVPVVVHIVYSSAEQNITNGSVYSQLAVINEDFGRKNKDTVNTLDVFKSVAGNPCIQFYIADVDGQAAITRTSTSHGPFFNDDLHVTSRGGRDGWDTKRFLNIWVAALSSDIIGYGNAPGSPPQVDGVAVDYRYFGRNELAPGPYNLGRTLTHEIGHWLGLQHPWGAGGCDSDDGISDTPDQDKATAGCALNQVSCGVLSMVQNFMNTSYDACLNLFTREQCAAMRSVLIDVRPDNYTLTGVITAASVQDDVKPKFYPNPLVAGSLLHLVCPKENGWSKMTIADNAGRIFREYVSAGTAEEEFDLSEMNSGVYIIHLHENKSVMTYKLLINKGY